MKFIHMADCHIGSYRDDKLKDLSTENFTYVLDFAMEHDVDFILIAGDLFNTALPGIDNLKKVTKKLHQIKQKHIPIYVIAGSHDFSPTGKTMLDVLEEAGLMRNVMRGTVENGLLKLKFTMDLKTQAKIAGIIGKRGMLDRNYYENLDRDTLEKEKGFKIFMFHTTLQEYKPKELEDVDAAPVSLLPKGFDYYAGGHVHYHFDKQEAGYGFIVYPGPVFPNSFSELENLQHGTFCLYEDGSFKRITIPNKPVVSIKVSAEGKSPQQAMAEVEEQAMAKDVKDAIVLIRMSGRMSRGKTTDVNLSPVFQKLYEKGAYFIMKNSSRLESEEFQQVSASTEDQAAIEDSLIHEHAGQIRVSDWSREKEIGMVKSLISVFATEKKDGEKSYEFERRLIEEAGTVLNLKGIDEKKYS